ncbi:phage virion morphogenesis protein [Pelomicrobium methylotrophicum]|uniref:Phage virion morphogenesis protein n=1 Tax=Pelomicrobium methylotrophicum TaxID=2602750 RepID=A0A5C7EKB5_9PROT|nr:phage virion morphogenesis protein [Pelomicrobium methylotrophicum]TXF11921.1 phage virion morphogenesis protein [Pelomicrobium methylotrophicum]
MIKIEIDDKKVRRALSDLQRRVGDMTPAMHAIGQALMEGSRERILQGRDWTGAAFAPNSPATLARKKGSKPLIDSKSFVTSRLHYEAGRDSVAVGSSAVQAAVLQFGAKRGQFGQTKRGGKIPWGDIPARRYLPVTADGKLDEAARSLILETIRAHLADG